ncbi:branched-chain amino acid transport system permease protein [Streptoalloteichus tenebrarius]|uniref:Branched-chain amino acid transport system permease protein n=1 Tax=Streptoalloteichus tenebrarius (strain ATCC 17920 / DSM 40477 / JCM 4838 / CBS 697.72 / NBRC 16177 / NCIMB 11028 / NRRL B-12390 / A12253. 1 / ISP 5477) TaxID=1933 RepID=A0ABT1I051_STRSD|nr:branched-chain amino acid ABC transporter permease [Streptoalloteichus tenebrarius]MCP2261139.1 branched-chain amino acid transport system permease protein [Streptoalloteichus tenebrarius]BFF03952.1 branched-chain amino acid ABC transporter permease [Streptoalloteichus tenebrarius]
MVHQLATAVAQGDGGWIDFNVPLLVDRFWSNTVDGLAYGSVYALVALGYTLVYGVLRLINFAHSEVFVVGAFAAYFTLEGLGFRPGPTPQLSTLSIVANLLLAGAVAMIASGLVAVVLERVAYRPLRRRNAPSLVFLITAIGASFVVQQLFFVTRGANPERAIRILRPRPLFEVFGAKVTNIQIIVLVAAVALWVVADGFVNRTRLGRGIRAVAQDPTTATLMGVNRERVIMLTFLVGGVLAGAAALFYLMQIPQGVVYNGGFLLGIKAFTAAVLGGVGNLRGALLGGLLLGVAENYGQSLLGGAWRDVVAFALLITILMFRPTGILGESLGRARV